MSRLTLGDAVSRFRDNDERVDTFINGTDTQSYTTDSGDQVPSLRKFLKDSAGNLLMLQEIVDSYRNFQIIILSSKGTVFKVGEARSTTLRARVFFNGTEITDDIPASRFRWSRVSMFPKPYPEDDATWNSQFLSGYKTVTVDVDAVHSRATFFCEITAP